MHTVCFSKLLSGFTGFLMAGKKHVHQLLDKKNHLKFHLKVDQISKLSSLLSSAKFEKKGFKIQITIHIHTFTILQFF